MVTPSQVVEATRIEFQQRVKNEWNEDRLSCLNYYDGLTEEYTRDKFSVESLKQVAVANNNIFRRVINRISLVNMVPPIRTLTSDDDEPHPQQDEYTQVTKHKDTKLPRAERYTNALRLIALVVRWDDVEGVFRYQVVTDFEPTFGDDPFKPIAIDYPIATFASVGDTTPEKWRHLDINGWDEYEKDGGVTAGDDMGYGVLPVVFCFADGVPETEFLDVAPALDLRDSNHAINVALTNKNANTHFQSFGQMYMAGVNDTSQIGVGPDKIPILPDGATMNILSPPDTLQSITASVQSDYIAVAQNYGLTASFVEGTSAESGVALRIRNQELTDSRRQAVTVWRDIERQLYDIEVAMLKVHQPTKTYPVTMSVDYSESTEVMTPQEQRDHDQWEVDNGLTTWGAILLRDNPDQFTDNEDTGETALEQAEAWVAQNKVTNSAKATVTESPFAAALLKPVDGD